MRFFRCQKIIIVRTRTHTSNMPHSVQWHACVVIFFHVNFSVVYIRPVCFRGFLFFCLVWIRHRTPLHSRTYLHNFAFWLMLFFIHIYTCIYDNNIFDIPILCVDDVAFSQPIFTKKKIYDCGNMQTIYIYICFICYWLAVEYFSASNSSMLIFTRKE